MQSFDGLASRLVHRQNLRHCCLLIVTICLAFCQPAVCEGQVRDRFASVRQRMVSEAIVAEGVTNPLVLDAMHSVPRHEFVSGSLRAQAYHDMALPIGSQQTISSPYIVAYMTETIDPKPGDRVLEIGTGSGYQAAVLASIAKEVYSIEIVATLAKSAEQRLKKLGYTNVHVRHGDGYLGWPEHAPFDKIIVTCSPESVPEPLVAQLREGGMMIIPMGERYQQSFYLLQKVDGVLEQKKLVPTLFVPMTGESEERREVQPEANNPRLVNSDFEMDSNQDGRADGWHYQRQTEMSDQEPMSGQTCLRFANTEPGQLSQALQGCGVNGRKVAALDFAVWVRREQVAPGAVTDEFPALVVHYYDSVRRDLGTYVVFQWRGSENWQQFKKRIPVPPAAREMIVRIGLNGGTGTLDLDGLQMAGVLR